MPERLTYDLQAFDAPVLANVAPNLSGNRISRLVGKYQVQYGALNEYPLPERLVIAHRDVVHEPTGERYHFREYLDLSKTFVQKRFAMIRLRRWK